jgi:16S rRNA (cytosine967-C5)-methyltransferase
VTPAARLAAAIEVLDEIGRTRGPADGVIKAWGRAHRFAGSKDRKAIAEHVYVALRARARSAWRFGADDGRALALGALADRPIEDLEALFSGEGHAPGPLTTAERAALAEPPGRLPDWVEAGVPEWIAPIFQAQFGADWIEEGRAAILDRAPVDLRVNALSGPVEKALNLLKHEGVEPERTPFSAWGLRLPPGFATDVQTLKAFTTGWIEVQDEASQIAAFLAGALPGDLIVDYCAGGGGKTLALAASPPPCNGGGGPPKAVEGASAAAMLERAPSVTARCAAPPPPLRRGGDDRVRLIAADIDPKRLDAMDERLARAGAAVEKRRLGPNGEGMEDLEGLADLVFVDAPCSGSGTWRRHPEAAWRLTPETVARLAALQSRILAQAAKLVKPGGRLVYATCSMLEEENGAVAAAFAAEHPAFRPRPAAEAARTPNLTDAARARLAALADGGHTLQLTPRRTGTDGFFAALFERTAERTS